MRRQRCVVIVTRLSLTKPPDYPMSLKAKLDNVTAYVGIPYMCVCAQFGDVIIRLFFVGRKNF